MKTWLLAGLFASGIAVAATPVPVKDFLRAPSAADVRISPDGKHLAMTIPDANDRNYLVIVDREAMKVTASLRAREGDIIDSFTWVNDDRVVASIATKVGGLDEPVPTGELYGINANGDRSTVLFSYRAEAVNKGTHIKQREARRASATIVDRVRGDKKRVLVTVADWDAKGSIADVKPEYGLLDVYTGRFVATGSIPLARANLVADNTGAARLAWANDNEQFRKVLVRGKSGSDWTTFADSRDGVTITPLRFAADNRHFYALVGEGRKPRGLYRIDMETRERTSLHQGSADPLGLVDTRDGNDAFAVVTAEGVTGNDIFNAESPDGRLLKALENSFPGQWVDLLNFSDDGKLALVRVSSDRNPGDIYLFDTEKKSADYLTSPRTWLEPELMAKTRPIQLKSRDGVDLHGYLTVPNGADDKNLPTVVLVHGGPYGVRHVWNFDTEVQLLASRGYAVLSINFRGSGGYGLWFEQAGHREWGGKMQDDVTDATRWAIEQGHADPKRVCIYGASYGGYAALEGAAKEPDLYRCAIGYIGVYDLRLMRSRGDIGDSVYGRGYLDMILGTDSDQLWTRSPVAKADRIKAKVMLVAGGEDQRAPAVHSERMRDALKRNGAEVDWLYKPTEGHGFYRMENRIELYERLLAFLQTNIGTPAKS